MKKRWSSLSQPDWGDIDMTDKQLTPYQNKDENGNEIGADKWENNYHTRSKVNDETLKKKHILFLGDSFVYGHGVKRGNTISDYFNEMVSEDYSCFNLAEPGSGFDTALLRLQQWCNGFGDQVHTIYFGISEITRLRHWEAVDENWQWEDDIMKEDKVYWDHLGVQYSPSFHNATGKTGKRVNVIRDNYTKLLSKVNSVAKLHTTISAVINLSKVHNFKVYFFSTSAEIPTEQIIKEHTKEQTASQTVKWCNAIGSNPVMIAWEQHNQNTDRLANPEQKRKDKSWDSNYIPNDGHWNSKGCNLVARMLYEETYDWY
jgi:hypothetical protein